MNSTVSNFYFNGATKISIFKLICVQVRKTGIRITLRARMENWNQDLPDRYSKFRGLYIKFQGHGKWPWTW